MVDGGSRFFVLLDAADRVAADSRPGHFPDGAPQVYGYD